jgi:hypothetical protein
MSNFACRLEVLDDFDGIMHVRFTAANGATGKSDMAGEAARVAVEPSGSERDTMANGKSDIEGKAVRVKASERSRAGTRVT